MMESIKQKENETNPIEEATALHDISASAQASQEKAEVERRIAQMEAMQKFQLIAKKRSRPFWKKMLSIK